MRNKLWIFTFCLFSCLSKEKDIASEVSITAPSKQDSIFSQLLIITHNQIPNPQFSDSLAFLILPVQASCPSCMEKAIDSLLKYKEKLKDNHFIVISANGGRKTINYYFRQQNAELPDIPERIFIDSTNQAGKFDLFESNPAIYYTTGGKAYLAVLSKPATIKNDLRKFFSGF